jgi:hypothetical protein
MANFYGSARSNYFKVKDEATFLLWAKSVPGLGVWSQKNEAGEQEHGVYSDDGDSGCWPSCRELDDNHPDYEESDCGRVDIDLTQELSEHLLEGQVAVLMEAGAEKLRYVTGSAVAVDHTGKTVTIFLSDIYKLAHEAFGVRPNGAEY